MVQKSRVGGHCSGRQLQCQNSTMLPQKAVQGGGQNVSSIIGETRGDDKWPVKELKVERKNNIFSDHNRITNLT